MARSTHTLTLTDSYLSASDGEVGKDAVLFVLVSRVRLQTLRVTTRQTTSVHD